MPSPQAETVTAAYLVHGLAVRTTVPLAAGRSSADMVDIDVRVVEGRPLPAGDEVLADCYDAARSTGYRIARDATTWTVAFPEVASATFDLQQRTVVVTHAPGVGQDLLSVLLSGPVLTTSAMARGAYMLHASAVSWGGHGAVALTGPAGAGKSTVAQLLVGDDRSLLSDDALRIDVDDVVTAHRGTVRSRLRSSIAVQNGAAVSTSADGRFVVDRGEPAPPTDMLRAVLCPQLSPMFDHPRVRAVPPAVAVAELAMAWPLAGVSDPGLVTAQLAHAADLVARVPVYSLEVPWGSATSTGDELVDVVAKVLAAEAARAQP